MDSLPAELPGKPNKGYMPSKVLITLDPIFHLNCHKNRTYFKALLSLLERKVTCNLFKNHKTLRFKN